jgi:trehalose 6-phosphate synthase
VVVANRAPFSHERLPDGEIAAKRSASGLVTALEPMLRDCSGTWVAQGCGSADRDCVDASGRLDVPGAQSGYRLRYVWVSSAERRGYYDGFSNEALWPLCHSVPVRPVFRATDFAQYREVNRRFAAAAGEEAAGGSPLVFVQDYHLALAPRLIRARTPSSTVVSFWHIPWPDPATLASCPWRVELLDGLLGSDIVGVQTPVDRARFIECASSVPGARIDGGMGTITYRGRTTRVQAYPVGVEWDNEIVQRAPSVADCRAGVCRDLSLPSGVVLGVGVDRLDYTKGIVEKVLAIERLLEMRPEMRGRLVFVQVAEPSRDALPAYRTIKAEIEAATQRINARFGSGSYQPVLLRERHHDAAEVYTLYRAADFCYVGSLHDGMNLVAKEFVCARTDERGVLVLSRFAGAANQLRDALMVNPGRIEASAATLSDALAMSAREQTERMRRMRTIVAAYDTRWWASRILGDAREIAAKAAA